METNTFQNTPRKRETYYRVQETIRNDLNYILIPEEVVKASIPWGAKIIYGHILRLHKVRNGCFAQNPYFAEKMWKDYDPAKPHEHDKTIQRYLFELRRKGYIWIY
jgi:hypothetical protein